MTSTASDEPHRTAPKSDGRRADDDPRRERNVLLAFWGTLFAGSAALFVVFMGSGNAGQLRWFALALLVAAAAASVGAMLGFLFGLPRSGDELRTGKPTNGGQPEGSDSSDLTDGPDAMTPTRPARANNNLLEISDWLTKIIVGAGLVGLKDLVGWIGGVARNVGAGTGLEGAAQPVFGGAVLTFYFGWGFLFLYIQTRTIISVIFVATERTLEDVVGRQIRAQVRDAVEVQVRDKVVPELAKASVGTIMQLLYSAPREAEKLAREFIAADNQNGLVWLYLACAVGQQHAESRDRQGRARLRQEALDALKSALRLDPELRGLARGFMYEDDENHLEGDNDLASFRDDSSFQELVGPPPVPSRA